MTVTAGPEGGDNPTKDLSGEAAGGVVAAPLPASLPGKGEAERSDETEEARGDEVVEGGDEVKKGGGDEEERNKNSSKSIFCDLFYYNCHLFCALVYSLINFYAYLFLSICLKGI